MFPKVPRLGTLAQPLLQSDKTGLLAAERILSNRLHSAAGKTAPAADALETNTVANTSVDTPLAGEDALKALIEIRDHLENIDIDPQIEPDVRRYACLDGVTRAETLSRTLSRELSQLREEERKLVEPYLSPRMVGLLTDGDGVCLPSFRVRRSGLEENALVRSSALSQAEYRALQGRRVLEEIRDLAAEPPNNLKDLLP